MNWYNTLHLIFRRGAAVARDPVKIKVAGSNPAAGAKLVYNYLMTKNPILNAFGASLYIVLVVSVMTFVTKPLNNKPDTFGAPIILLFVLTLSVVVMAYLFFYQPLMLFIEGKKKEAVNLFLKTVGIFGVITIVALTLLFSGLI